MIHHSSLSVLLPVKELGNAKLRLAGVLSPGERRALVLAMLGDALAAVQGAELDAGVLSPDPEVLAFAQAAGAQPIPESPRARSLNQALERALRTHGSGASAALIVLPDTPLAAPQELLALLSAGAEPGEPVRNAECAPHASPGVVLVPDRGGRGTNALLLRPPDAIAMRFGRNSLRRHLEAARSQALAAEICRLSGLALDLDRPADLEAFLAAPGETRTHRLLEELCVGGRLGVAGFRVSGFEFGG